MGTNKAFTKAAIYTVGVVCSFVIMFYIEAPLNVFVLIAFVGVALALKSMMGRRTESPKSEFDL